MKNDISTREDIFKLVTTFYSKILKDELLKSFFTKIEDWDAHYERLTTFWQSSLFLKTKYLGNPLEVHVKVDQAYGQSITQEHFGQWLNLWYETIDELFEGEVARVAKNRARKMSTFLYLNIFEARSE